VDLYCVIYHFAETGLFAGFYLVIALLLAGIYNRELIENVLL
jgi:hypothetical protein